MCAEERGEWNRNDKHEEKKIDPILHQERLRNTKKQLGRTLGTQLYPSHNPSSYVCVCVCVCVRICVYVYMYMG